MTEGVSDGATGAAGTGSAEGQARPVLADEAVVESVLPGLDAVPGGWTHESGPTVVAATATQCGVDAPGVLFCGDAEYEDPATNNVAHFEVYPFSGVEAARGAYRMLREDVTPSAALPELGDESYALSRNGADAKVVTSVVRVGSVVAGVVYHVDAVDWTEAYGGDHLEVLTRMLVERVQQACEGQVPSARATL